MRRAERVSFPTAARVIALLAALCWLLIGMGLGGLLCR